MYVIKKNNSFTLIELLIVIGILAILTVAVVIILNPGELLKEARDSSRMSDLASIDKAVQLLLSQNPSVNLGTASTVYVSLPDTSTTCSNLGLPTLPSGYTYHCVTATNQTLINGTGWIPVDLTSSNIQNMAHLPIDPSNNYSSSTMLYYTYEANPANNTFETTAMMESSKYRIGGPQDVESTDGGTTSYLYEKGSDLTLNPINDTGLVGYWTFDEGSGTTIYDKSGSSYNGTLINSYIWQGSNNCKVGGCLTFNGTNTYVSTSGFLLPTIGAVTISLWANSNMIPSPCCSMPVSYGGSGYYWYISRDNNNTWRVSWMDGGSIQRSIYNPAPVNSGQWYYLTFVNNGTTQLFYVNAIASPQTAYAGFGGSGLKIVMGGYTSAGGYPFGGDVDDVRIYNRALSPAEVLALYNATK